MAIVTNQAPRTSFDVNPQAPARAAAYLADYADMQRSPAFLAGQGLLLAGSLITSESPVTLLVQLGLTSGVQQLAQLLPAESAARPLATLGIQAALLARDPAGAVLLAGGFLVGNALAQRLPKAWANPVRTAAALGAQLAGRAFLRAPAAATPATRIGGRKLLQDLGQGPVAGSVVTASELPNGGVGVAVPQIAPALPAPLPLPALAPVALAPVPAPQLIGAPVPLPAPVPLAVPAPLTLPAPAPASQPEIAPALAMAPAPGHGPNLGVIVGGAAGGVVGLALLALCCCCCYHVVNDNDDE